MKKQLLIISTIASLIMAADYQEPSVEPFEEKGIMGNEAPMLVCVGWDDNAYHDAVTWFGDWVRDKKNKDGSPVRTTFLSAMGLINENFREEANPGLTKQDLLEAWKKLYEDGHEYGNHTYNHYHGKGKEKSWWDQEIISSNEKIKDQLGVPEDEILGFRTPFLEYSTGTFQSLKENGVIYDCSIEFGYDWVSIKPGYTDPEKGWVPAVAYSPGKAGSGFNHYWPYTLDNSFAKGSTPFGGATVEPIPGFWEIPVIAYQRVPSEWDENNPEVIDPEWGTSGVVTGFDFNMWKVYSKDEFLRALKFGFHQRLKGNRSPFNLNLHTDNYSEFNREAEDVEFLKSNWEERRLAIEEFLDYVIQYEDVRVVPYNAVLDFMRNPQKSEEYVAPTKSGSGVVAVTNPSVAAVADTRSVSYAQNRITLNGFSAKSAVVKIYNVNGRLLKSENITFSNSQKSISTESLSGMVFLSVEGGAEKFVQKLILQ